MSTKGPARRRARRLAIGSWRVALVALVAIAFGAGASAAYAVQTEIVTHTPPVGKPPPKVHYFTTIQAAVDATHHHDWVLIEPGVYNEEVKVTRGHSGIFIRGMDRNTVILDGQNKPLPGGSNGIEVFKTNNVWIENLTVRNFDRATPGGPGGNEIWWNGGEGSNRIGANGWFGRYLTAYDTGLNGGYGIFTNNETRGEWENIYASGFNDSGMYLGACPECNAHITGAVMENNALGYSGSNSGGNLVIENSVFNHNTDGIAPNSENPGDGPPPQNGACPPNNKPYGPVTKKLPYFESTAIARCTIFRSNRVEENNNLSAPDNPSTEKAPWGVGIQLPGTYADLVEKNVIVGNPNNGVLAFEYPNPFPIEEKTIFFALNGNRISDNTFLGNGSSGLSFAGDVTMAGGVFTESTNNCLSGNVFTAATYPAKIEEAWGCQNATTPNPYLGEAGIGYLLELQEASKNRKPVGQPAPPAQPTMPNPCEGAPANPLCPGGVGASARKH